MVNSLGEGGGYRGGMSNYSRGGGTREGRIEIIWGRVIKERVEEKIERDEKGRMDRR